MNWQRLLITEYKMAIKQLSNGKYLLYTVDYRGRKIRIRFEKKEDAKALLNNIAKEKYGKKLVRLKLKEERFLFADALKDFELTKSMLRPKSIQKYSAVIKQIGLFAESEKIKYLDQFISDHGTLFYNELIKEKMVRSGDNIDHTRAAPKTINFYLQTLKSFFQEEVAKDHILKSPVLHLKFVRHDKKKPEFYTIDELKKFFSQEMQTAYRHFFIGLLNSGMRFAEASNLTWDDIDFKKKLINVRPKVGHKLKTINSERAIPMNEELFSLLTKLFSEKKSNYVFASSNGNQIRERRALEVCKGVASKAGLTTRSFLHKFRATYATLLVRNKISLESIKELLGHSSLVETEQSYANNDSNNMHSEVSVLDGILEEFSDESRV